MGSMSYFITFKNRTKEDLYSCLNEIGQKRFLGCGISIEDIITLKDSILDFKKGESYVRTSGDQYPHRTKEFLKGVASIKPSQCRVVNDEIYWVLGYENAKEFFEIEEVDYRNGKYEPFIKSDEDVKIENKYGIERIADGYYVRNYECSSKDVKEGNTIKLINADKETYRYIYYDFKYEKVKDGEVINISSMGRGYNKGLSVYATTSKDYGYMYFDKTVDCDLKPTEENIKLVTDSVAAYFKRKGLNVTVVYGTFYDFDEFEKYKKENSIEV